MGSKLKILIPSGIVIIVLLLFGAMSMAAASDDGKILKGVSINGTSVGGMTKEEASKLINSKFNKSVQDKVISIYYNDKKYTIDYKKLKAEYNIDSAIDKAYKYGKEGNIFSKLAAKWNLKNHPKDFEMEFTADTSSLDKTVKKIVSEINIDPKDAKISFDGTNFITTPDSTGLKVNETKLKALVKACVRPDITDEKVEVPVEKVDAKVTQALLKKIDTKISTFTTTFRPTDVNRTGNLKIATQAVNGHVVMPGEIFSMNKALGPRVASKGYTDAPIFINNTVVPSLAGGICQVTTTVYNAALLANFQIVARKNHGLLTSYIGPGKDATISGDAIDMKFKNTNNAPLYIQAYMGKSTLTVNLYSANEHPGQKVVITAQVLERTPAKMTYVDDSTLEIGKKVVDQKPISGAKSVTYKKVYQDGVLVKTELVSKDTYNVCNGVTRVGTKPVTATSDSTNNGVTPTVTPSDSKTGN